MNLQKLLAFILARLSLKKLFTAAPQFFQKMPSTLSGLYRRLFAGQLSLQKLLYWIVGGILGLVVLVAVITAANTDLTPPPSPEEPVTGLVGVSLAGSTNNSLSGQITQALEAQGLKVNLLCANGDTGTQKAQVQTLLNANVSCLILEPVDSLALLEPLAAAKEKGVPVIACNGMLMDTDWVWGCITFDYFTLGKLMARKVAEAKNLDAEDGQIYKIELFMGAPESLNSLLLYQGAMEVLDPYLRTGKLIVPSGRTYFEDTYTGGTSENARQFCALRLKKSKPDIIFAGSDEIATGCKQALLDKGYKPENWPVLIGQGGANAQDVKNGYQIATYAKAPIVLAENCAEAAVLALSGKALPDTSTQHNHVFDVPTRLLPTSLVEN